MDKRDRNVSEAPAAERNRDEAAIEDAGDLIKEALRRLSDRFGAHVGLTIALSILADCAVEDDAPEEVH
jgi:hypothetical protein